MSEKYREKYQGDARQPERRKPLRQTVVEIDQELLRLLLRRHNILERMRRHGRLDPAEEKFLRESWQGAAAKVSRDPDLSGRFFALLQDMSFLPRLEGGEDGESLPGAKRRQFFNLAPSREAIQADMPAPLDGCATRAWLYLAAAAGLPIEIEPSLQNVPIVDFEKALERMGSALAREQDKVCMPGGVSLERPDRVIYVGDSEVNFYFLLAHYLGRPSRARFEGDTALKLADFAWLRQALPMLGTRLVHVVPKSAGLPCRIECSGILPDRFVFAASYRSAFAEALLLAAPFYEKPFALDLGDHPGREKILERVLPILKAAGATFTLAGSTVNVEPAAISIPQRPQLPVEPALAFYLLSFAAVPAGEVILHGCLPMRREVEEMLELFASSGLPIKCDNDAMRLGMDQAMEKFSVPANAAAVAPDSWQYPLICGLCASAALLGVPCQLPEEMGQRTETIDFMNACGLGISHDGRLAPVESKEGAGIFTAETAGWALALALAARARKGAGGFQLSNPGIANNLWPGFWSFYNNLPNPGQTRDKTTQELSKSRRRILTEVVAVPPEIREEDWER